MSNPGARVGAELVRRSDEIHSAQQLSDFVRALRTYLRDHPENWEADALDSYLDGLANFLEADDAAPENVPWPYIAKLLYMPSIYE